MLAVVAATVPAGAQTIVIDVGHSRSAPGSTSASGVGEFEYNRRFSLSLADALRRRGATVLVPNAKGDVSSLAARPAAADRSKAALFLSVHHDAIQTQMLPRREEYRGFSTWTSGSHPAAAASARCADAIGRILVEGGMRPALFHAERIPGEGRDLRNPSTGRYRRDDLAVLRLSRTPAVLLEVGVIVNPIEESWLARTDVRGAIAERVADAALRCIR